MKKEIAKLNATPSKRIFYSIIADYDLNRSICELVDNGLDVWGEGEESASYQHQYQTGPGATNYYG